VDAIFRPGMLRLLPNPDDHHVRSVAQAPSRMASFPATGSEAAPPAWYYHLWAASIVQPPPSC